jgi:hypothetical protein
LGQTPSGFTVAPPSAETMEQALAIFRQAGLETRLGG